MTPAALITTSRRLWICCVCVAIVMHGAVAFAVVATNPFAARAEPARMHIALLPPPPAPEPAAEPAPEPEPEPEPQPLPEPEPLPEPVIQPEPVPQPAVTPPPPAPRPQASVVQEAPPAPPAPRAKSDGEVTWESRLLAHLNRHKRYPREARFNRQEGVVQVRFVIDRSGALIDSALAQGCGHAALDEEALAMVRRAAPMPPPPAEAPGATFEFVAPVEFFLR